MAPFTGMKPSLLTWPLLAIGVCFLLQALLRKNREDKTKLWLMGLTGGATILRAILFWLYGFHDKDLSILQAKSLGLASGVVIGLGLALLTHSLVGRFAKPPAV